MHNPIQILVTHGPWDDPAVTQKSAAQCRTWSNPSIADVWIRLGHSNRSRDTGGQMQEDVVGPAVTQSPWQVQVHEFNPSYFGIPKNRFQGGLQHSPGTKGCLCGFLLLNLWCNSAWHHGSWNFMFNVNM